MSNVFDPARLIVAEPGDHRVRVEITETARTLGIELNIRPDRTFLCSTDEFAVYAAGHKGLLLENFYRWMRKQHRIFSIKMVHPSGAVGTSTKTIAAASAAPVPATSARR